MPVSPRLTVVNGCYFVTCRRLMAVNSLLAKITLPKKPANWTPPNFALFWTLSQAPSSCVIKVWIQQCGGKQPKHCTVSLVRSRFMSSEWARLCRQDPGKVAIGIRKRMPLGNGVCSKRGHFARDFKLSQECRDSRGRESMKLSVKDPFCNDPLCLCCQGNL